MTEKVKLVARQVQKFAGKILKPGEEFDATEKESRTLIALGRAAIAEKPKPKPAVLQPLPPPENKVRGVAATYKRKDLLAEDSPPAVDDLKS